MISRKQWKKNRAAIEWFYEQPEDTEIWCRKKNSEDWFTTPEPTWSNEYIYVINDKYADFRKAIADGKEVEYFNDYSKEWEPLNTKMYNRKFFAMVRYRIKPKIKFPRYLKNNFMVVKQINENEIEIVFIFNPKKAKTPDNSFNLKIGDKYCIYHFNDLENFKEILYDKKRKLWDGQPVWCWDRIYNFQKDLRFYDAKNKCTFEVECGARDGLEYSFYEPYPYLDDKWVIKAYNKLKF